jgi:hypothetical protein
MSDARDKILARRAKFVAAALAGISVAYGEGCKPEPCLKIATQPPDAAPAPCLEPVWVPPVDAGADAREEASAPALDGGRDDGATRTDAAAPSTSDAGAKRTAPNDPGADAGTKIAPPPATRQHKPPFAPPQPCLLMPILQERKK